MARAFQVGRARWPPSLSLLPLLLMLLPPPCCKQSDRLISCRPKGPAGIRLTGFPSSDGTASRHQRVRQESRSKARSRFISCNASVAACIIWRSCCSHALLPAFTFSLWRPSAREEALCFFARRQFRLHQGPHAYDGPLRTREASTSAGNVLLCRCVSLALCMESFGGYDIVVAMGAKRFMGRVAYSSYRVLEFEMGRAGPDRPPCPAGLSPLWRRGVSCPIANVCPGTGHPRCGRFMLGMAQRGPSAIAWYGCSQVLDLGIARPSPDRPLALYIRRAAISRLSQRPVRTKSALGPPALGPEFSAFGSAS